MRSWPATNRVLFYSQEERHQSPAPFHMPLFLMCSPYNDWLLVRLRRVDSGSHTQEVIVQSCLVVAGTFCACFHFGGGVCALSWSPSAFFINLFFSYTFSSISPHLSQSKLRALSVQLLEKCVIYWAYFLRAFYNSCY